MKTYLSEKAVCKWLDISKYQLGMLKADWHFPYITVNRELHFYDKAEICQWMESREHSSESLPVCSSDPPVYTQF